MNEFLPLNYVPKMVESYTDKELEYLHQCDMEYTSLKWLKTIDRIKTEFGDTLRLWMENTTPVDAKELQKQFDKQWSELTYKSTQATNCAMCGEYKHTPLRRDDMGGYVCLTCIDKELNKII